MHIVGGENGSDYVGDQFLHVKREFSEKKKLNNNNNNNNNNNQDVGYSSGSRGGLGV